MCDPVIEFKNVTKKYSNYIAIKDLNLSIQSGEIFGLLGPNGAGKTTIILMLLGLSEANSGYINICGSPGIYRTADGKQLIGYLPDNVGFYKNLTGRENLELICKLNKIENGLIPHRIETLLQMVDLDKFADKKTSTYSRGMKQRLGIAQALVKFPKILILDEPTLGLDPSGIQELLTLIKTLNERHGITIIISSHNLEQVQKICHRVCILISGKIKTIGSLETLAAELGAIYGFQTFVRWQGELNIPLSEISKMIKSIEPSISIEWGEDHMVVHSPFACTPSIVEVCINNKIAVEEVRSNRLNLSDIYERHLPLPTQNL